MITGNLACGFIYKDLLNASNSTFCIKFLEIVGAKAELMSGSEARSPKSIFSSS